MRSSCVSLFAPARALAAGARLPLVAAFAALLLAIATTLLGAQTLYAQAAPPCTQEYWCGMGLYPSAALEQQEALDAAVAEATEVAAPLSEEAATEHAHQTLVFQSLRDGNWEIYISRLDGYGRTRLTDNATVDSDPRLSPTMQSIAFVSDRDSAGAPNIYIMNLDGSNVRRLTYEWGAVGPRWTPDGAHIYFTAWNIDGSGNVVDYDIKRVRVADGAVQTIVGGATIDFDVAIKFDGSELVWVRPVDAENGVLIRAKADGSGAYEYGSPIRYLGKPAWSPSSAYLSFEFANADGWSSIGGYDFIIESGVVSANGRLVNMLVGGNFPERGFYAEYTGSSWTHDYTMSEPYFGTNDRLLYTEYRYIISRGQVILLRRMGLGYFGSIEQRVTDEIEYLSDTHLDSSPNARWSDATPPVAGILPLPAMTAFESPTTLLRWPNREPGGSGLLRAEVQLSQPPCCKWVSTSVREPLEYPELCHYDLFFPTLSYAVYQPYYRVRLTDKALNVSAWSLPQTTLCYFQRIQTIVTDVRGKPIAGSRLKQQDDKALGIILQQPSPANGRITAYTWWNLDVANMKVSHPAYGEAVTGLYPDWKIMPTPGHTYYVSPAGPDIIQNGSFDDANASSVWTWNGGYLSGGQYSGLAARLQNVEEALATTSISQSIPTGEEWATMINPTLAFAYRYGPDYLPEAEAAAVDTMEETSSTILNELDQGSANQLYFEVIVRDMTTLSSTVVFRRTNSYTDWRTGWADLSAWQGKPIEIIFALQNPDLVWSDINVTVDHVTLSPWRTPQVSAMTPTSVDISNGVTLTITGSNFIDTPTVQIARSTASTGTPLAAEGDTGTELEEITIDPATITRNGNTLTATLPANLAPGVYNILVINPGGDRSFAPATLTVGNPIWLPRISQ